MGYKVKMVMVFENLFYEKVILDHGIEVVKEVANVLSFGNTTIEKRS